MRENPSKDSLGEVAVGIGIGEAEGWDARRHLPGKIAVAKTDEECEFEIEFEQPLGTELAMLGLAVKPRQRLPRPWCGRNEMYVVPGEDCTLVIQDEPCAPIRHDGIWVR